MYPSAQYYFSRVAENFALLAGLNGVIEQAAGVITQAVRLGHKVMFCGNGGSAADSQHLAAELMGRYLNDRVPLSAIALTIDNLALTVIGNDYGYSEMFSRQLRGLGGRGDVLVALSTSGNSENVLRAMNVASELDITTIALTRCSGGKMRNACDIAICVPADETNHIQELHIAVGHYLCDFVENAVC